jgi:hypothetical protein
MLRYMEQRISLVTLGVVNVTLAREFYERLGWHGQEVEQTVFFQAGGMAFVLWGADKLAADAGVGMDVVAAFAGSPWHTTCDPGRRSMLSSRLRVPRAARSRSLPVRPSTGATPDTSPTRTVTPGRSPTTPASRWQTMAR